MIMCGESFGRKSMNELVQIPKLAIGFSTIFYAVIGGVFIFFAEQIIPLFQSNAQIIPTSIQLLGILLVANLFVILYEVQKYTLQSLDESRFVLGVTACINLLAFLILIGSTFFFQLTVYSIFTVFAGNYFFLATVFYLKYQQKLKTI